MSSAFRTHLALLMKRTFRVLFIDDPWLKLICLVLAVLVWFYIDGELMESKVVDLQMKPSDIIKPDNLEIEGPSNLPKFAVKVRGPRRQLEFWQQQNLRFRRPLLDNPHPGLNWVTALPSDVEADAFTVLSVQPKEPGGATVTLDATGTELKPVRVRTRGDPKAGFLVDRPSVSPPYVKVFGPAEILAAVSEVWTEEIQIGDADADVFADVSINPNVTVNGKANTIRCEQKVRVTVPINPNYITRAQTLDVWARVPPGLALRLDPATVQVELVIEERDFQEKDILSKVSLYVDWPAAWEKPREGVLLGPTPVQVKFVAPPRVRVRGINDTPLPTVKITGMLAGGLK